MSNAKNNDVPVEKEVEQDLDPGQPVRKYVLKKLPDGVGVHIIAHLINLLGLHFTENENPDPILVSFLEKYPHLVDKVWDINDEEKIPEKT